MAKKKPAKASKKKAAPKKAAAPKTSRKTTRENPGMGHNLTTLRKEGSKIVAAFLALTETMRSDLAGYRDDFATIYENGANQLGMKESVLKKELKNILNQKDAEARDEEMDKAEREQTEMFRAAMQDTKYAKYAQGELFPATETATADEVEQAAEEGDAGEDPVEDEAQGD